jgi:outer membrane lipoprotein SlyB
MSGKWVKIGAATVAVAALAGGGVAWAPAGDSDESVTGPEADRAAAAAVAHVGGGEAAEVERAEGGAGWEVEVKRDDGSTVEVNLDQSYHVVGAQQDSENGDDDSGPGDD